MATTVEAVFDGKVFRPDTDLDLKANTRYVLIIDEATPEPNPGTRNVWDLLAGLAGTVEAPEDWSAEHDHYISGAPKNGANGPA